MEETTVEVILFLHKTNHLPRIAHARNKGERRIVNRTQRLLVDGYDAQTRTAYEFSRMFLHKSPAEGYCQDVLGYNPSDESLAE